MRGIRVLEPNETDRLEPLTNEDLRHRAIAVGWILSVGFLHSDFIQCTDRSYSVHGIVPLSSKIRPARKTVTSIVAAGGVRLMSTARGERSCSLSTRGKVPRHIACTRNCPRTIIRSEEHTSELQSQFHLVCRLLLEKKKQI